MWKIQKTAEQRGTQLRPSVEGEDPAEGLKPQGTSVSS